MNNEIFEKNIKCLKEFYPQILAYYENDFESVNTDITVGVQEIAGRYVIAIEDQGKMYQLNSMYDDECLADVFIRSLGKDWGLDSKLLMYGFGNGIFARKFIDDVRKDCSIVIYEPIADIFWYVINYFDISDILSNNRVKFVFGPLYNDIALQVFYENLYEYKDVNTMKYRSHMNYAILFKDNMLFYNEIVLGAQTFAISNQVVQNRFGYDNSRNFFNNINKHFEESYSLKELRDVAKTANVPAIVVAAGPSLDKNIRQLSKAKGKCVLIACDTAIRPLYNVGIIPDVIVTLDGKKDERYLVNEESRKAPLFTEIRSGSSFLNVHTGKKFFYGPRKSHISEFCHKIDADIPDISTGGSIANLCFSVAKYLGCNKIVLMGQDLAYTDAKTHSEDTVRGEVRTTEENLQNVVWDIDIYGNPIRSSGEFILYKSWFEKQIEADKDLIVIDATEGGIYIKGTIVKTLADTIEEYCVNDFCLENYLNNAQKLLDDDKKKCFREFVDSIPSGLDEVEKIIDETLMYYLKMRKIIKYNNYHSKEMAKIYQKCKDNTVLIDSNKTIEYIKDQMQERETQLLTSVNTLIDDEKQELLTACELGEKYLRDMKDSINEIRDIIKGVQ